MERHHRKKIRIAFTHGDINGIGYELLLQVLADEELLKMFTPLVYGSSKVAAYYRKVLKIEADAWNRIEHADEAEDECVNIINCTPDSATVSMGTHSPQAGEYALMALERAIEDIRKGAVDALVTMPINKSTMPQDRFPYAGHTAFLGDQLGRENQRPLMILASNNTRVALVTEHIPISEVASTITTEMIENKLITLNECLIEDFRITKPRIAVTALNPHAGDNGLIGNEEQSIILPAIEKCRDEHKIECFGPYAADGLWGTDFRNRFDAILAMYHDQGLAPFKALCMSNGVNYTAALNIVRTSPDHGTGYDIVGQGIADGNSLRQAIYMAIDATRNRLDHERATHNPLPKPKYSSETPQNIA